jgi:hypothetical protein
MSDTSGSGFGKFVPGFEFLQSLAGQAAGGMAQGLGGSLPQLPNLSHWVAPTVNVEDLEKRIEELKAVHFWLDQNTKALSATIQALEVQKMTLATLHQMNFSLGDVANALKIKAAETVSSFTGQPPAPPPTTTFAGLEVPPRTYGSSPVPSPFEAAPAPAPVASAPPADQGGAAATAGPQRGVVDPVQWWGALSQQFQNIAANAMKDVAKQTTLDSTRHVASGLTEQAVKTATGVAGKVTGTVARNAGMAAGMGKAAARAVTGSGAKKSAQSTPRAKAKEKPPAKATPKVASKGAPKAAAAQPLSMGDWPLPAVFFPGFQAPATEPKPARKSASAPVPRPAGKKSPGTARKKPAAKSASGRRASKS